MKPSPVLYPNPRCHDCAGSGIFIQNHQDAGGPCRCISLEGPFGSGLGIRIDLTKMWGVYANQKLKRLR